MKKTVLLPFLFIVISILIPSCSSDDGEFPKFNKEDKISTVSDSGYMSHNENTKRWIIISLQSKRQYHTLNLPKEFKQMWKKVKFTGDIYPYVETSRLKEVALPIAGHSWYFIEVKHIEEYN